MQIRVKEIQESGLDKVSFDHLEFGKVFTDYMLESDFKNGEWGDLVIKPLEHLVMHPGVSALHYGQTVFEGLKAYKNERGEINIFRLSDNVKRLNKSAERMEMAQCDEDLATEAIKRFVELQKDWVPERSKGSLYIRPFIVGAENTLRAKPSEAYKFIVIACPVGFYYDHPLNIVLGRKYSRAASGGVGYAKAGGNYAASFYPTKKANKLGYDQILWTDVSNDFTIEELGSANFFFVNNGTLYTPELKDSILAGITRNSVIELARQKGMTVEEKRIKADDLKQHLIDGNIDCMFATGTAASITFVNKLTIDDDAFTVKSDEYQPILDIKKLMDDIKFLDVPESFGWTVKV